RAEGRDDGRIERRRPEALAPADGAVIAHDLDQAGAARCRAVEGPGERLAELGLQHVRLDVGDAHQGSPARYPANSIARCGPGVRCCRRADLYFPGGKRMVVATVTQCAS